jgi:hypothetical protein
VVKLVATLSSYGRRAVVAGGVADRYASELARAGQSNRPRAGTGSASPERATRPPLWPAGMAEGNRETFGPTDRCAKRFKFFAIVFAETRTRDSLKIPEKWGFSGARDMPAPSNAWGKT